MPGTPFDSIVNTTADALGLSDTLDSGRDHPGNSVVIEELEVPNARRITLKGRAMPYRGVAWGGEQASKVTYYPGNPVATIQVLGPREDDTDMEGMWKDRFMPGSIDVSTGGPTSIAGAAGATAGAIGSAIGVPTGGIDLAEDAAQLFHSIRRAGTLLRVQWLGEVRIGILKSFEANYDRAQDLRWKASFEWIAWDDYQKVRSAQVPASPSTLLNQLNLVKNVLTLAPDVASSFQAVLVTAVNDIADTVGLLFNALEALNTVLDTPGAVLGAVVNNANALNRQVTELLVDVLDVRWPNIVGAQAVAGPTVSPLRVGVTWSAPATQETQFEAWRKTLGASLNTLRRTGSDITAAALQRVTPQTTKLVTVGQGSTLYDISRTFYGSSDFVLFLARANGFANALVPAGTIVRVPPRPNGPVSQNLGMSGGRNCAGKDGCG